MATTADADGGLRAAVRAWVSREMPLAAIPDDGVLDALLAGPGGEIFAHLVARVVSSRHAATLRARLDLARPAEALSDGAAADTTDAKEAAKAADVVEEELVELRARLKAIEEGKARLGCDEDALRKAAVGAAVESLDEGTALCGDLCAFVQERFGEAGAQERTGEEEARVAKAVREVIDAANEVATDAEADAARAEGVLAEMRFVCAAHALEDVAPALHRIAEDSGELSLPSNDTGDDDDEEEDADAFEKRLAQSLQDRYLSLFEASEAPEKMQSVHADLPSDAAGRVELLQASAAADAARLSALDSALTALANGNRSHISLAASDASTLDARLVDPLPVLLESARDAQSAAVSSGLAAIERAQGERLSYLSSPAPARALPTIDRTERLRARLEKVQGRARRGEMANEADALAARARRVETMRRQVDDEARTGLLPLLGQAEEAAAHAKESTVPAAARAVYWARHVEAFVAARATPGQGGSGSRGKDMD